MTTKYRIRIFSSFCDSADCKETFERLCQTDLMSNYGPDNDIYITNDDDYTHAIILNTAIPELKIPKENVAGLAFEPPVFLAQHITFQKFVEYSMSNISKYLIGSNAGLPANFIEHYSYMWHITPPRTLPEKNRLISIMVSDKRYAPGHIFRHSLVKEILRSNLNIDIYGRGCRYYNPDSRLKYEFQENEPYENYYFHICIENFQTPCYTSEKYTNCVLWGTTPIYWGATNIDAVFPEITIKLQGDVIKDMNLIRDIVYNPNKYRKLFDQNEIRPKINLLKNLDKIFSK